MKTQTHVNNAINSNKTKPQTTRQTPKHGNTITNTEAICTQTTQINIKTNAETDQHTKHIEINGQTTKINNESNQ